jgi:tetratricopeptide (TPR) repeat protein
MELNPESPKIHLSLSYFHLWISRDTDRALRELETAQRGLPNSTTVMVARATIYEVQGRFEEMINLTKQAHELNPLSNAILLRMALAYWFLRRYPEGIEAAERAIALDPDEPWSHLYKALLYWSWRGAVPEARAAIEKTRTTHSWVPYVWFWQEIGERKFEQALARVESAGGDFINIKISRIPRSLALAYLYEHLEQPERAMQYYLEAKKVLEIKIEKTPDDPRLHSNLGIALASLGERERAVEEGKRAVQILPISKDSVYGTTYIIDLALTHTILGEYESALDQIESLMSIPSPVSPGWLSLDPRWDKIKELPRYKEIMQKYFINR